MFRETSCYSNAQFNSLCIRVQKNKIKCRLRFQINTLSVYCHGGFTIVSLTVEQCIVIATVHIPVAAINYFTAQCRAKHTSTTQVNPIICPSSIPRIHTRSKNARYITKPAFVGVLGTF